MKLSDFITGTTLERDADFASLGYVDTESRSGSGQGHLVYFDKLVYLQKALANTHISAVMTTPELAGRVPNHLGLVVSDHPRLDFYKLHTELVEQGLYQRPYEAGRGMGCRIHPSAIIAEGCRIGDHVVIGEQVVIREPVWLGSHVTIEAGAKLGMEGILYNKTSDGPRLIPHGGYVHIHDHAAVLTNAVIVRSIHDTDVTEIGRSALIGLGTIIGHEAKIGDRSVISNQCVIARRSRIGHDCFLGTQVTVKENISIGAHANVMIGSVVVRDVAEGATVSGNFASDHRKRMIDYARNG